jgi:hypothetical protein
MGLSTQVSGTQQKKDSKGFVDELTALNIQVNRPFEDVLSNELSTPDSGIRYMAELELFQSIASSSFHIIDNTDSVVDFESALQILYAMSKKKPVVVTAIPKFATDVDLTIRDIIQPHLHQLFLVDAHSMNRQELANALKQLPNEVDYQLTTDEEHRIRIYNRTHFRELLHQDMPAELVAV